MGTLVDCKQPPPLTDDQISAVIDDDADISVYAHLDSCPACATRLQQARQLEARLDRGLFRWKCPTSQQLGDFHMMRLSAGEQTRVATHVHDCAACQSELATLQTFMADEQAITTTTKPANKPATADHSAWLPRLPHLPRLEDVIAVMLPQTGQLAMRGDGGPLVLSVKDLTLFVETEPLDQGDTAEITVRGSLIAPVADDWTGALVHICHNELLLMTATLDDQGDFECVLPAPNVVDMWLISVAGRVVKAPTVQL